MISSDCPPGETLERFLAGTLTSRDEATIVDHVDGCTSCQKRLDTLSAGPVHGTPATLSIADASVVEALLSQMKAVGAPSIVDAGPPDRRGTIPTPTVPGYEIVAELGRGGMGIVYKAVHKTLNRTVALKMILSGVGPTDADRQRFLAEAEATARLQHPNIVQLFEVGEADGRPYLALEYIPGGTLHQRTGDRPQQPLAAARLIETLARAVHAAHTQQVVHRDLKPQNVLLAPMLNPVTDADREYGIPKLTDFGLATRLDAGQTTMSRAVTGTPSYMAPEQIPEGIASGPRPPIGPLVDVYALGAILYQLLTGRPPFLGVDWVTTLLQTVRRDPVPVRQLQPGVPRDLETICLKCLEKEPYRRYDSAADLADDLRRFLDREPIRARPIGTGERMLKWARRRPVAAAALGVAGLGIVSALFGLMAALAAVNAQRGAEARAAAEARAREQVVLKARIEADRLRDEADANLYLSQIAQTYLLWRDSDVGKARLTLAACREKFRGWEWLYLNRLCHDGLAVVSLPTGYRVAEAASGPAWFAAVGHADPAPGQPAARPVVSVWSDAGVERLRTLTPTAGRPIAAVASPGDRLSVVVAEPGTQRHQLYVWDLFGVRPSDAQPPPSDTIHLGPHWDITPDGRYVLSDVAEPTPRLRLWDIPQHRSVVEYPLDVPATDVALSSDGSIFAWADGGTITVARCNDGRTVASWPAPEPSGLVFSPDGTRLAYVDRHNSTVVVRSVANPENEPFSFAVAPRFRRWDRRLCFTPDGNTLFAPTPDGVRLWSLDGGGSTTLGSQSGFVHEAVMGTDGRTLATAGDDSTARLWSIGRQASSAQAAGVYRGHTGPVTCAAFSADNRRLITGGTDGVVAVRDLTTPQAMLTGLAQEQAPAADGIIWFTPSGQLIEQSADQLRLWNSSAGILERVVPLNTKDHQSPLSASLSAGVGNRFVLTNPQRNQVVVRRLDSDHVDPTSGKNPATTEFTLSGHRHPITAVALAANGSLIITGSAGLDPAPVRPRPVGEVCIWDGKTGELLQRIEEPDLCVSSIAVTADGRSAAVATGWPGWDRTGEPAPPASLRILATFSGKLGRPVAADRQGANPLVQIVFHPAERLLVAAPYRQSDTLHAYDLLEGQKVWSWTGSGTVTGIAFHPDGSRLAAAGTGGVTLLDGESGSEAIRLPISESAPRRQIRTTGQLAFDPTGTRLAASVAGKILIWEASSDPTSDRTRWRAAHEARSRFVNQHSHGESLESSESRSDLSGDRIRRLRFAHPGNSGQFHSRDDDH